MEFEDFPGPGPVAATERPVAEQPAVDTWSKCLDIIRGRVNGQSYKAWFEPIQPVRVDARKFYLEVPSQFFSEWLDEHYIPLIREVFAQVTGNDIEVVYLIRTEERDETSHAGAATELPAPAGERPVPRAEAVTLGPATLGPVHPRRPITPTLNRRYTFENYIKGESNQFACAAALAVANNPGGTSFNPLVIYGGVGLGKTHLVHSIGNQLLKADPNKRVLYTSSEKFTVDFVDAIQRDTVSAFSDYYRSVDLLIVDDIQFFTGKEKTQDIFFHTFNTLHQMGKQIVLSSDKPPKELRGLNERLVSRFQWGLTADVQPPDLETRIAILLKKSTDDGVSLPRDVVEFIAANITSNIRELEGCLISLLARASLENKKIDLDLTRNVVRSIVGEVKTHITIDEIQRTVCEFLSVPPDLLRAKTRKQEIVTARQISMYLSKELTNSSLKTIGLHFGGRDHSTVIHAYQTIEDLMKEDPKTRTLIQQLKSKLEIGQR
jgi:chromosomal replication initiator protein